MPNLLLSDGASQMHHHISNVFSIPLQPVVRTIFEKIGTLSILYTMPWLPPWLPPPLPSFPVGPTTDLRFVML